MLFNVKLLNILFHFLRFIEEYRLILNVAIRFVLKYHRKYFVLLILIYCKLYNNRIYFFQWNWLTIKTQASDDISFLFFSTFFYLNKCFSIELALEISVPFYFSFICKYKALLSNMYSVSNVCNWLKFLLFHFIYFIFSQ